MDGRIKIHRSSAQNELYFSEPFTRWQARQDMILIANHTKGKIIVRGNIIPLERGQLGHSENTLAGRWRWSRGKVRRFLKYLENEQQIVQQKNTVKSVITIANYNEYQGVGTRHSTADSTTDGQQTVQQTDTNKNDKNDKEGKEQYILELENLVDRWNSKKQIGNVKGLKQCRGITKDIEQEYKKIRKKYQFEDVELGIQNYILEINDRDENNSYSEHRFSFYEFIKQKNGFIRYYNQ